MKILFLGDSHGDSLFIQAACRFASEHGIDKIVQLGDFGVWFRHGEWAFGRSVHKSVETYGVPLYFVRGNHEDGNALDRFRLNGLFDADGFHILSPTEKYGNIRLIPDGHVWVWGGLSFGGFGGAVSIDQDRRIEGFSWWPNEVPDQQAVSRLSKVDVLITHDSTELPPADGFKIDEQSRQSRASVQRAVEESRPLLHMHGHYHLNVRYVVRGVRTYGLDMNLSGFGVASTAVLDTDARRVYSLNEFLYGVSGTPIDCRFDDWGVTVDTGG